MIKPNNKIRVTFCASNEKLISMFTEAYPSVSAAKDAMETDAKFWCAMHDGKMKWVNSESEDYLEAVSKRDKLSCIWQYFA